MNVLITGINGHLARRIALLHSSLGDHISGIYRENNLNVPSETPVWKISSIRKCEERFDLVYLVGAFVPRGNYDVQSELFFESNMRDVHEICSCFRDAHFVFCSSVSVYGNPIGVIDEHSPFNQPSMYGLSKLAGELIVRQCGSYSILRLSSLYGAGLSTNNFVNRAVAQALEDGGIKLWGNGSRKQNYLHIDDAARYLVAAGIKRQRGVFLATGLTSHSNREIAECIRRIRPTTRITYEGRDSSPSFEYDNTLTQQALDFSPVVDIETGISEMVTP